MTTPTLITYLHLCHRKLWLRHNHINMENATGNVHVAEGKWIDETTYQRRSSKWRSLNLGNAKIDHYDPVTNTIREVKKSSKLEHAHIAQVKYYIYLIKQRGLDGATGIIEYPKQKKTTQVVLTEKDEVDIQGWINEVERITNSTECPLAVKKSYCRSCAYYDFCFV